MISYSAIKEMVNDAQKITRGSMGARRIVGLLRVFSFLIVFATFVVQYCGFEFGVNVKDLPMFPITLNQLLDKYLFCLFVGLIFYKGILNDFLRYLVINVSIKFEIKLLPIFNTVEDVFEIGTMFILLLRFSGNLLLCLQGVNVIENTDKNMYSIYLIYCFWWFVNWLYIKNKNYWYFVKIKYTPYFDCNGKRISEKDSVIYYGRLYDICLLDAGAKSGYSKKEWYLLKFDSTIAREKILLEEAVRDERGKIKVYEYGMGEKWHDSI